MPRAPQEVFYESARTVAAAAPLSIPYMIRDLTVLVFALAFPSVATWMYFVAFSGGADRPNAAVQAAYALGKGLQFGLPIVYVWLFYRDQIRVAWPAADGLLPGLGFGLLVALGACLVYFLWLKHFGLLERAAAVAVQKLRETNLATPLRYLLLAVFYSLAHAFLEEYYWRWFVFGWLRNHLSLAAAVTVASAGFMAHHVILLAVYFPEQLWTLAVPLSLCVAVGGAFWCWLYDSTGSLYGPWLSHLVVDAAIFAVGYDVVAGRI